MIPGSRSGGAIRRIGFACAVLTCVALPALVAGASIDAAPAAGEVERLRGAFAGTLGSRLAEQFELATAARGAAWPADEKAVAGLLSTARLAQVLGLFAASALVYVAVLLARGRLAAFAACIGLAALPPVMVQGHVLRPETAGTVFTVLGLVLLQCMLVAAHSRRSRGPARSGVARALAAVCSATALGLAVGATPSLGGALQLPLGLAMLVSLQVGLRAARIGVRRGMLRVPAHAVTGRLWAPALAALMAFVMALVGLGVSLTGPAEAVRATPMAVALLPESAFARAVLVTLAALGAASLLLRTGVRFGRRGRAGADLALLVYCFTQLAYGLSTEARFDPLPAAPALAVLFGEGVLALAVLSAWAARRRRGVSAARPR